MNMCCDFFLLYFSKNVDSKISVLKVNGTLFFKSVCSCKNVLKIFAPILFPFNWIKCTSECVFFKKLISSKHMILTFLVILFLQSSINLETLELLKLLGVNKPSIVFFETNNFSISLYVSLSFFFSEIRINLSDIQMTGIAQTRT